MSSNVTSAPGAPVPVPAPSPSPAPATAPAATAGPVIQVAPGQALPVTPGQTLAARVIAAQGGQIELALGGGVVTAASDLPMEPGQTLRLIVGEAGADRVTLRVAPEAVPGAPSAAPTASPPAALAQAGVPPSAAQALLSTLADAGVELPPGPASAALAARAAAVGVQTPAQGAAFARLEAAGLPTTPAAVAGLAQLIEGAPLGRALAALADALAARTGGGAPVTTATPQTAADGSSNWTTGARPNAQGAGASGTAGTAGTAGPAAGPGTPGPGTAGTTATPAAQSLASPTSNWNSAAVSIGQGATAAPAAAVGTGAAGTGAAGASAADRPDPSLKALATALASLTGEIAGEAADGQGAALRRALADLGVGIEHRLHSGEAPDKAPLRSLLLSLAGHPGVDQAVARVASGLADGVAAQTLAGATLPPPPGASAAATDPSQNGAYMQLPLPGGGTAEVRVSPDGGREGGDRDRPRRLAFLLHLSALGPVMIEATAGPHGVDATVRTTGETARAFLGERSGELTDALRSTARSASVSVERMSGPAPERLIAPPPSSGLDLSA